jgi:hypothetical protein
MTTNTPAIDPRVYFLRTEKDGRLALYICCSNKHYVTHHGFYKSRESAIHRKQLAYATEIDAPSTFTVVPLGRLGSLQLFAEMTREATR